MTIEGDAYDQWLPKKPLRAEDYRRTDKYLLNKKREDCNPEELALRDALVQQEIEETRAKFRNRPDLLKALVSDSQPEKQEDDASEDSANKKYQWSDGTEIH